MVDKELIGIWRNELKPAISFLVTNELINRDGYDGESYWKRNETGEHER